MNHNNSAPMLNVRRALTLLETLAAAALLSLLLGAVIPLIRDIAKTGVQVRMQSDSKEGEIALRLIADELARDPAQFRLDVGQLSESQSDTRIELPEVFDSATFDAIDSIGLHVIQRFQTAKSQFALVELRSETSTCLQIIRIGEVVVDETEGGS